MKSLFKATLLAITMSLAPLVSVQAAHDSSIDMSELDHIENIIVPTYDVVSFWYQANNYGDASTILLENGNVGLGFYRQESDGTMNVGYMDVFAEDDMILPYDWDVIFYMQGDDSDLSIMAINMHDGSSRIFKPNAFSIE